MVAWKMPTFFNVWRLTVVYSYSKKKLESGDNKIKKKGSSYCCIKTIVDHCRSTPRLKLVNPVHLLLLLVDGSTHWSVYRERLRMIVKKIFLKKSF
jgi:hypothetical protein